MAFVDVNPRYRALLARRGWSRRPFLRLAGRVRRRPCGSQHRARGAGEGAERFSAYLKREQHIRWRHRLHSAWAGFGFVSRCYREALVLQATPTGRHRLPEMIAAARTITATLPAGRELGHANRTASVSACRVPVSRARQEVAVLLGRYWRNCTPLVFSTPICIPNTFWRGRTRRMAR